MNRGFFITLEGGEGSGKSTQIKRLSEFLQAEGYEVVATREPGGTFEAEKIRTLLVNKDGGNWTPMAEMLLFFAARAMHTETLIKPAVEAGKIVLCDRYTDSTRAYQGYGHERGLNVVNSLAEIALGGYEPDLTLILDISPGTGLARSGKALADEGKEEECRFENMELAFHERLRQGYLDIARTYPERCRVVSAEQSIENVTDRLLACIAHEIEGKDRHEPVR